MLHSVIAAVLLSVSAGASAQDSEAPREAEYQPTDGERIVFDVYREGKEFGTHELTFVRAENGDLTVGVEIRLRAGFGPITVFRYEHDSTETWRNNELIAFNGRTLKDGETYQVGAVLEEGVLKVDGEGPDRGPFEQSFPAGILPSSHWHGYRAGNYELLNTEFGTPLEAVIEYVGEAEIEADGGTIRTDHYELRSSLELDLWYDESGRWVACAFTARGQTITYVRRSDPVEG